MRLLFNDIVPSCIVSATSTDSNFPAANLAHVFLRKRWQSTLNSDTVTIETPTAELITSIYADYTNATSLSLKYFGFDTLGFGVDTIGFGADIVSLESTAGSLPIDISSGSWHGSQVVSKVEITATASEPVYIGKIAMGEDLEIIPPTSFWDETFEDRSIVSVSQTGQVLSEYVEPLRKWAFDFTYKGRAVVDLIQSNYRSIGVGKPIFIDPDSSGLDFLYCRITSPINVNKSMTKYVTSIQFTEAR